MAAEGAPSFVHLPALRRSGDVIEVEGDEAHYLARVVRVRAGERVTATDGEGTRATLEVLDAGPPARLRIMERTTETRSAWLELACGAPEGERGDWLIEKLAELGVGVFQPLETERGRWERFESRRPRWERLAIAAMRQSRSAFRLQIRPPIALPELLARAQAAAARWTCRPEGERAARVMDSRPGASLAAIGPSSGFSAAELNALSAGGFTELALASTRLRTETAAVSMAALWAAGLPAAGAPEPPAGSPGSGSEP